MKVTIHTVSKNGKPVRSTGDVYAFDSLTDAGAVRVTGCGQENVYFEWTCDLGHTRNGYCKCL